MLILFVPVLKMLLEKMQVKLLLNILDKKLLWQIFLLEAGVRMAEELIDNGAAGKKLEAFIAESNR